MVVESGFGVTVERAAPVHLYRFDRYFRGFDRVEAVRSLFGRRTRAILHALRVEFFSSRFGYMGTSDVDGHLMVSRYHLEHSDFRTIYLDVVHELCHVKQFRDGRPLFYPKLSYVDAPSEVEAYRFTVREGQRIGMTEKELVEYLRVEWITPREHRRLVRRTGLGRPTRRASGRGRRRTG